MRLYFIKFQVFFEIKPWYPTQGAVMYGTQWVKWISITYTCVEIWFFYDMQWVFGFSGVYFNNEFLKSRLRNFETV